MAQEKIKISKPYYYIEKARYSGITYKDQRIEQENIVKLIKEFAEGFAE
jgi:ATP-dependent Lon protease